KLFSHGQEIIFSRARNYFLTGKKFSSHRQEIFFSPVGNFLPTSKNFFSLLCLLFWALKKGAPLFFKEEILFSFFLHG
ncbi:MAG: hypothetical protein RR423_08895, partial [Hydrogenoanaerobacterium sp.]